MYKPRPPAAPLPPTCEQQNDSTNALAQLAELLASLASKPSVEILDALRGLERKTSTVFTLLKASVYSIVLQQEIDDGGGGGLDAAGGMRS